METNTGDFWVLNHVWNNPEQIPHLQLIIQPYLEGHETGNWGAERDFSAIDGEINVEQSKITSLRTDAEYQVFLQTMSRLRQELDGHSDKENAKARLKRVEDLTAAALKRLEELE